MTNKKVHNNNRLEQQGAWGPSLGQPLNWVQVAAEASTETLDHDDYALPKLSLVAGLALASRLVAVRLYGRATPAGEAHAALLQGRDTVQVYLTGRGRQKRDVAAPRHELQRALTSVANGLLDLAALDVPDSAHAQATHARLFGDMPSPKGLTAQHLWVAVEGLRAKLARDATLRTDLERLAQPQVLAKVRLAHGRLGAALKMEGDDELPEMLDEATLRVFLIRRIWNYLVQVMASAAASPEARRRAIAALAPVPEARMAQRRGRTVGVEEEEEVEAPEGDEAGDEDDDSPTAVTGSGTVTAAPATAPAPIAPEVAEPAAPAGPPARPPREEVAHE